MATARTTNYNLSSGTNLYLGMSDNTALINAVATLGENNSVSPLLATGFEAVDGFGAYVNESALNDTAQDWAIDAVWCPALQKMSHQGTGNGYLSVIPKGLNSIALEYDAMDNRWSSVRNPYAASPDAALSHQFSLLAIKGTLAYRMAWHCNTIFVWDLQKREWIGEITPPPSNLGSYSSAYTSNNGFCYYPDLGTEGSFIHLHNGGGRLNRYDIETSVWSNITEDLAITDNDVYIHYNPVSKRIVCGSGEANDIPYILDTTGTVTAGSTLPAPIYAGGTFVGSGSTAHSIMIEQFTGDVYAFNTLTGLWESAITNPFSSLGFSGYNEITAATMPEHKCILLCSYGSNGSSATAVYRY